MNTPLSDSARKIDRYGMEYVDLSDCRAIEERLNECVEEMEEIVKDYEFTQANPGYGERSKAYYDTARKAIANARKPL